MAINVQDEQAEATRTNYDSAWKEVIEKHVEDFLEFFFPMVYESVDFSKGYEFKSQELREIMPISEAGKRIADEVVKVYLKLKNGRTGCLAIYIHIEIQGSREDELEKRAFIYFYRLFDRVLAEGEGTEVISLLVLTDEDESYRPDHFKYDRLGFEVYVKFPMVKVIDYKNNNALLEKLDSSGNMMAMVVKAQLKSYEAKKGDDQKKFDIKRELIYQCFRGGYQKESIATLIKFLDYVFRLPKVLEKQLKLEIVIIEEENKMPYVTSWERMAKEEGVEIGMERGVKIGVEKGDKNARLAVAKQMLLENFPIATIEKLTGLSLSVLTDLSKSISSQDH